MEAWAARGIRGEKLGGLSARKCVAVRYASLSLFLSATAEAARETRAPAGETAIPPRL